MRIIGCDYHPGFQQIALVDTETGELQERRLQHREEAEKFYRELAAQGMQVRVGMEASGHARWFERLLAMFQQLRYFCGCVYHFDHSSQPVLTGVWDGCKAERLFRTGNRAQHLCRTGHRTLGRNEYQLDH